MPKALTAVISNDRDTMNSEINRDFETSAVNDSRKLQTIVDCAYMSALTRSQGCLNDCVINLHAVGDSFGFPHEDRLIVYKTLEKLADIKCASDFEDVVSLIKLSGFYENSNFIKTVT